MDSQLNEEFSRIQRLPPYVFNIVNDLKMEAHQRGEDIVDFGMGNPDQPTPPHIIEKMVDALKHEEMHRYSVSRGITPLREAICNWYKSRYDIDLDPETEAIVTIGSKEGLAHLAMASCGSRRHCIWCQTLLIRYIPMDLLLRVLMYYTYLLDRILIFSKSWKDQSRIRYQNQRCY